jgi:hypothetical protein
MAVLFMTLPINDFGFDLYHLDVKKMRECDRLLIQSDITINQCDQTLHQMSLILDLGHNKPVLNKIATNLPLFLIEDGLEPLFLRQVKKNNSMNYEICTIESI